MPPTPVEGRRRRGSHVAMRASFCLKTQFDLEVNALGQTPYLHQSRNAVLMVSGSRKLYVLVIADSFTTAFVFYFVVIDPVGSVPLFMGAY